MRHLPKYADPGHADGDGLLVCSTLTCRVMTAPDSVIGHEYGAIQNEAVAESDSLIFLPL